MKFLFHKLLGSAESILFALCNDFNWKQIRNDGCDEAHGVRGESHGDYDGYHDGRDE